MLKLFWIIEIVSAVLLILLVLLHSPKGDGIANIGGGSNLFSSQKNAESGLNKITMYVAIAFAISAFVTGFRLFS